jgi:predicted enzyme related to lactoylglutathione lyase
VGNGPGVGIVLDCLDPEALAPFWATALGYVSLGPIEDYVVLVPDGRPGPRLLLQRVPEGRAGKNRMHLDIDVADQEATAERLEALGATRVSAGVVTGMGCAWIVMADPEGNEFCLCDSTTTESC